MVFVHKINPLATYPEKSDIMGEIVSEDKKSFKIHSTYETYSKKDYTYQRVK